MTQAAEHAVSAESKARFRTAVEWWDALGNVPFGRIVFDPPPGTATEADVLRLNDKEDRLCELVNGTLVEKTMGYDESVIAARIIYLLSAFVVPKRLGQISAPDGMMQILEHQVRIPDVAFVALDRFPNRRIPKGPIPAIWPDLAVEVLSESNTRREMQIKLTEYFAAGTRLVWYVDPKTRTVEVYTSPERMRRLGMDATLDGGEVLLGFGVQVAEIFDID
ncbi:MAG TPA: Uma2 family endonuclease [Tepidisphaeraceae bacterium]|nr:Uma2 family endonuclease [Tepidisphaeraceae bacterium]